VPELLQNIYARARSSWKAQVQTMTPEGKTKKKITEVLKAHGAYYEMPVPTGFGKSGLDYTGCHKKRFFSIEAKAPGKKPTPRQELTIKAIENAGGKVFVIDGDCSQLESWLNE